jgi:3',5'-cyclic AMP phosphodiesterase CpdA
MTPRSGLPARLRLSALVTAVLLAAAGCSERSGEETRPSDTPGATAPSTEHTASQPSGPVTIMGAGDIAGDRDAATATAQLIEAADPDAVFTTGDNAYPDGSTSDYAEKFDPTWGSFKDRTRPVPGNHDHHTDGAAGYVDYFGIQNVSNDVDGGLYYAWDVGNGWRAYALNTEISTTGDQLEWLQDDMAAHPGQRYILYAHRPRFTSSTKHGPFEKICPLWDALAASGGLEIVIGGHNHQYERFTPMDCAGRASADGARSFVIGSGGAGLYGFDEAQPGSEYRNDRDFGVLRLALYEDSYEWEFIASGMVHDGDEAVETQNAGQILDKGSADV